MPIIIPSLSLNYTKKKHSYTKPDAGLGSVFSFSLSTMHYCGGQCVMCDCHAPVLQGMPCTAEVTCAELSTMGNLPGILQGVFMTHIGVWMSLIGIMEESRVIAPVNTTTFLCLKFSGPSANTTLGKAIETPPTTPRLKSQTVFLRLSGPNYVPVRFCGDYDTLQRWGHSPHLLGLTCMHHLQSLN